MTMIMTHVRISSSSVSKLIILSTILLLIYGNFIKRTTALQEEEDDDHEEEEASPQDCEFYRNFYYSATQQVVSHRNSRRISPRPASRRNSARNQDGEWSSASILEHHNRRRIVRPLNTQREEEKESASNYVDEDHLNSVGDTRKSAAGSTGLMPVPTTTTMPSAPRMTTMSTTTSTSAPVESRGLLFTRQTHERGSGSPNSIQNQQPVTSQHNSNDGHKLNDNELLLPDLQPDIDSLVSSIYLEDRQMMLLQCALEENCLATSVRDIQFDMRNIQGNNNLIDHN